jgi:hypothetical protein
MLRTYGRDANGKWVVVQTDANGFDDNVWLTTLAQALKLTPGESPFFADVGIPAQQSIVTQVYPDFYVSLIQSRFAQYFASLNISRQISQDGITPEYRIDAVTNKGATISGTVAI